MLPLLPYDVMSQSCFAGWVCFYFVGSVLHRLSMRGLTLLKYAIQCNVMQYYALLYLVNQPGQQQSIKNLNMIDTQQQSCSKLTSWLSPCLCQVSTIVTIILTLSLLLPQTNGLQTLSMHGQLARPNFAQFKTSMHDIITQDDKLVSFVFSQINYEISSDIYIFDGYPSDDQLFDISAYNQYKSSDDDGTIIDDHEFDVEDYCSIYPTSISAKLRDQLYYSTGPEEINVLKYAVSTDSQKSKLFILTSQSTLLVYIFDKISVKFSQSYPVGSLGIMEGKQLASNVEMLYLCEILYIFTSTQVYRLDQDNIVTHFAKVNIEGVVNDQSNNTIVDVGVMNKSNNTIWVCRSRNVQTYRIRMEIDVPTLVRVTQYPPIPSSSSSSSISPAVAYSAYSSPLSTMFLISNHSLYLLNTTTSEYTMYGLDSPCQSITVINYTLYLACQYDKINYVAQIALQFTRPQSQTQRISLELVLNRYYDESILQGIRDVQPLGYNRVALIGDQAVVVIGEAVNRAILIDLEQQQNIEQNYDNINSFGMIDYFYIEEYSTKEQSIVLVVGQDSLQLVSVFYEPPQVECVFSREQFGSSVTVLAVFNTTQCPQSSGYNLNIPPWQIACQTFYPIQIYLGAKEYEQKTATLIIFLILLFLFTITLICAGWGVKIRNKANSIIKSIKKKIQKMQKAGKRKRRT